MKFGKKSDIKKKNYQVTSWIVNPGQTFRVDEEILNFFQT